MDFAGINNSDIEPGYKNATRSWLKESFRTQLQHSGSTQVRLQRWRNDPFIYYIMKTTVTVLLASANFSEKMSIH